MQVAVSVLLSADKRQLMAFIRVVLFRAVGKAVFTKGASKIYVIC